MLTLEDIRNIIALVSGAPIKGSDAEIVAALLKKLAAITAETGEGTVVQQAEYPEAVKNRNK